MIQHIDDIYICGECYSTRGEVVVLFKGPPPIHDGVIYCEKCENYDTYIKPTEEIEKINDLIQELYEDKERMIRLKEKMSKMNYPEDVPKWEDMK